MMRRLGSARHGVIHAETHGIIVKRILFKKETTMDHDDLPDDAPGGDCPDHGPYADEE